MESDVREALRHLTTAFENHLEAVILRRGPVDAAVDDAYEALAEAFERYEDLLDIEYGEELPLVVEEEVVDDLEDTDLEDTDLEEGDEIEEDEPGELGGGPHQGGIDDDLEEFDLRD
jgi:hypothetical protein